MINQRKYNPNLPYIYHKNHQILNTMYKIYNEIFNIKIKRYNKKIYQIVTGQNIFKIGNFEEILMI